MNRLRNAVLTIDDGPTHITAELISYLVSRQISPVVFFLGEKMEKRPEVVDFVLQSGVLVANHSYSHAAFSSLLLEQAKDEIDRTQELIDAAYARNGLRQTGKHFRFPFGDKGGQNKPQIQDFLRSRGYVGLPGLDIQYGWFSEHGLDVDRDIFWTFDTEDYKLTDVEPVFTMKDIQARIESVAPKLGGSLVSGNSDEIILTHDNEYVHAKHPFYYREIVEGIERKGLRWKAPSSTA